MDRLQAMDLTRHRGLTEAGKIFFQRTEQMLHGIEDVDSNPTPSRVRRSLKPVLGHTAPTLLAVADCRLAECREDFPAHCGQGSLDGACLL